MRRLSVIVVVLCGLCTTGPSSSWAQDAPAALFVPVAPRVPAQAAASQGVVLPRAVRANLGVFGPQRPAGGAAASRRRVLLELQTGLTRVAALSPRVDAGTDAEVWGGALEGVALSAVNLVVDRANGQVTGTINSPEGVFVIRPMSGGLHLVGRLDVNQLPPEGEPRTAADSQLAAGEPSRAAPASADSADRIDVLVVYTPAARNRVGGTSQMSSLIALGIADANTSYGNSAIGQRLRLVHTAEIAYTETPFDMGLDLNRLTGTSDGFMDSVHALRNTYAADLVALLTDGQDYCGTGWLPDPPTAGTASYGFSVTTVYYACIANGTLAHELGHNMGARHDRFVEPGASQSAYNFGYVSPGNQWRTIMAYANACGFCPRVLYWSNPDVNHPTTGNAMGRPAGGTDPADNRRRLNETALAVANYRQHAAVPAAPTLVGPTGTIGPTPTFSWNAVSNATSYWLWVNDSTGATRLNQTYTASAAGCGSGSSTCGIAPGVTLASGAGEFWVQASNAAGSGPWSSRGTFTVAASTAAEVTALWPVSPLSRAETGALWARVHNTGSGAFPAGSKVWFFVNGPGWTGTNWVGSADVSGQAAGTVVWKTFGWMVPQSATLGAYTYWAQVWTPSGVLSGWSPAETFVVGEPSAAVTSLWEVGTVARGQAVPLWARVANTSSMVLPPGTMVWMFVNGPGWTGSNWVGATLVQGLAPGATAWLSFNWTVPAGATAGTYTYWAQVWTNTAISGWSSGQMFSVQ